MLLHLRRDIVSFADWREQQVDFHQQPVSGVAEARVVVLHVKFVAKLVQPVAQRAPNLGIGIIRAVPWPTARSGILPTKRCSERRRWRPAARRASSVCVRTGAAPSGLPFLFHSTRRLRAGLTQMLPSGLHSRSLWTTGSSEERFSRRLFQRVSSTRQRPPTTPKLVQLTVSTCLPLAFKMSEWVRRPVRTRYQPSIDQCRSQHEEGTHAQVFQP